ncbi:MAG: ribonuclease H-like domain-containing protein [Candidatus Pacebacteria bacterium]|nr:ribonuclease H-like domain-containing protein [Candidatus Paceibacterota bacterium]
MRKVVFDIETRNIFSDVGSNDPSKLDISIVCAYDSETDTYSSYLEEELPKLWPIIEKADMLVGYNSNHFDIPLLNKYYHGDLSKIKSLDILEEIRKVLGRRVKLDQVAEATLGTKKSGHGLDAIVWWKKGEIDKIRKYCLDDVKITKDVYEYALKNGKLFFKEGGKANEIKLDTSNWEKKNEASMTFSLPF